MRKIILFLLLLSSSSYAQVYENDTVCLHPNIQSASVSEGIPRSIVYGKLVKMPGMDTIIIHVNSDLDHYFDYSSYIFPNDTFIKKHENGYIDTNIHYGTRTVLANQLTISNYSNKSIFVPIEDWEIILIQEAKDKFGRWHPIDYFIHSNCGNSYSSIQIPNEYSLSIKIVRYCGDFKTKLRVRISLNKTEYLSNEFDGFINKSQFDLAKRTNSKGFFHEEGY